MENIGAGPSPGPHIHCMPDEVLQKIFRYLGLDSILRCVLPVCRRWRDVAECRVLGKLSTLCIGSDSTLQFIREMRITLPRLRQLSICCDTLNADDMDTILHNCPEVTSFRTTSCSDETVAKLVPRWGETLQVLAIEGSDLTDTGLALLAGCSQLRELRLLYMVRLQGAGLRRLVALSRLEVLDLHSSDSVRAENLQHFLAHSQSAGRLRKVDIWGCDRVDNSTLLALAAACPCLEELGVWCCPWSKVTNAGLSEVLRSCHRLRYLNVLGTEVIQNLPEIPQLAPQLQVIEIGEHIVCTTDEAALERLQAEMPNIKIRMWR